MNYELLITFTALNVINVIIQTVKSIATVKCGKVAASVVNAIAYGLYTIVVVYTMADLPLIMKAGIVAMCNLIGVFIVKLVEEKTRKDKMWKIEMAIPKTVNAHDIKRCIENCGVPCNYIEVGKWLMLNCYCEKQKQTSAIVAIAKEYNGKISAYESKNLGIGT